MFYNLKIQVIKVYHCIIRVYIKMTTISNVTYNQLKVLSVFTIQLIITLYYSDFMQIIFVYSRGCSGCPLPHIVAVLGELEAHNGYDP